MTWWQINNQVVGNIAVEERPDDRLVALRKLWDSLAGAGLKGEQVDVDAKLKEAGVTDEKERKLSWDVYQAAKQVSTIEKRGASPTTYDSFGNELKKNAQVLADQPTRDYALGIEKNLRSRAALNERSTYAQRNKKSEGATSSEYDAMLARISGGGELPKWEEVEKISAAQVAALEKKNVPKGNREAIRDVLNNAYGMRANAENAEKFAEHREKYLKALNYRGEDNEGRNKNKGLSWTVSRSELAQFRSALDKLESDQKAKTTPETNTVLQDQLNDQLQRTRTETDQRRTKKRTAQKRTPQRKAVRSSVTPQRTTGRTNPSIADLRRLDEEQIKAMQAEQEAKTLMSPYGVLLEWNEDKRRQKIGDAEIRRREALKRADEIKKQMGGK